MTTNGKCISYISTFFFSFYNWKTNEVASSDSANYQVITDKQTAVLFKNKKDRNIVNVDPQVGLLSLLNVYQCMYGIYFFNINYS